MDDTRPRGGQAALSLGSELGPQEWEGEPLRPYVQTAACIAPEGLCHWIFGGLWITDSHFAILWGGDCAGCCCWGEGVLTSSPAGCGSPWCIGVKEGQVDFMPLNTVPHRVGLEFMFISITAPPSMLPVTSACSSCPCMWSAPAALCGAPPCPPLLQLLLFRAWRCLGCRSWRVWLCLFIYSKIVLMGTGTGDGREAAPVPAEPRKLPWVHQYER